LAYLGCQPAPEQPLTPGEEARIAEVVGDRFEEIATATNELEFDRLLGFYSAGEDLTYVARGRVTRSYAAFAELLRAQFAGVTGANLSFSEKYVDVLSREVVVVTALYQFSATVSTGDTAGSSGTFTCVYVLRDGVWEIQHSSHTFAVAG
jgi:hypothetical protein